ncbi:MAG: M15 family metallopeptidase [Solibacillus sp.]|jgi:zinc D-Ala-D-Ala carboxypeptidase|uniref:M15 family metallopeptidase n=1 Tax=Solibacillus sp. TaxID=1909654 RepID=UPI0033160895
MNTRTNRKSPIVLIASISLLLLLAILGSIYYKYEVVDEKNQAVENHSNKSETDAESDEGADPNLNEPTPTTPVEKPATNENPPQEVVNGYIVGQNPAVDPTYVNGILIVNKKIPLPSTYNKGEDPAAKAAFEKMAAAAKLEGFELVAFSGFRSYEYQQTLYDRYVNRDGKDAADRYSARPGYSEHQTGLAFDIGEKGREDLWLTSEFGESPAGQWLVNNAHQYGFILRYPKGKEDITGFMYESWHFRYLEGDTAKKIHEAGVTLEEYLGIK